MDKHIEKRKAPRVEQKLPIKVAEGDHCMVVETKNISASGVYFLTEKHLLPMSRVSVTLLMPTHSGKNAKVGCSGTVVRIIPAVAQGKTMYETAIFFDEITEKTKALLSRHIKGVLTTAGK